MSSSAQRDLYEDLFEQQPTLAPTGTEGAVALRRLAAERLAAHRSRRATLEPRASEAASEAPRISEAAQRVRDAVAERYRQSPSYREYLESPQMQMTVTEASAVAVEPAVEMGYRDFAATIAEPEVVEPGYADRWEWLDERVEAASAVPAAATSESAASFEAGDLQVRPFEELPEPMQPPERVKMEAPAGPAHAEELEGLEEEIEFRLAPEFAEHLIEPLTIQANIIEFPRQLVAPRKARPRLAEGPLRTDDIPAYQEAASTVPEQTEFQMRIFEVEEARVEETPLLDEARTAAESVPKGALDEAMAPEWQELVLDAPAKEYVSPRAEAEAMAERTPALRELPVASFELRLMSAVVDAVCVAMSFVAFVTVAVWMGGHAAESALRELSIPLLSAVSAVALGLLAMMYQTVFFALGASTPGMSYAGLVFRTLAGKEPSRKALRRRVGANVLATVPLGLGLLWSVFDRQSLGWNDRMSGVFLREF